MMRKIVGCDQCGKRLKDIRTYTLNRGHFFFVFCSETCLECYDKKNPTAPIPKNDETHIRMPSEALAGLSDLLGLKKSYILVHQNKSWILCTLGNPDAAERMNEHLRLNEFIEIAQIWKENGLYHLPCEGLQIKTEGRTKKAAMGGFVRMYEHLPDSVKMERRKRVDFAKIPNNAVFID